MPHVAEIKLDLELRAHSDESEDNESREKISNFKPFCISFALTNDVSG